MFDGAADGTLTGAAGTAVVVGFSAGIQDDAVVWSDMRAECKVHTAGTALVAAGTALLIAGTALLVVVMHCCWLLVLCCWW